MLILVLQLLLLQRPQLLLLLLLLELLLLLLIQQLLLNEPVLERLDDHDILLVVCRVLRHHTGIRPIGEHDPSSHAKNLDKHRLLISS